MFVCLLPWWPLGQYRASSRPMPASSGFRSSPGHAASGNAVCIAPAHRRGHQNGRQMRCICSSSLPRLHQYTFCCNAPEETLAYSPHFACAHPFLFHLLPGICSCGIIDCGIISCWFNFLGPRQICKMVVLSSSPIISTRSPYSSPVGLSEQLYVMSSNSLARSEAFFLRFF
jgi:hypothetical protein